MSETQALQLPAPSNLRLVALNPSQLQQSQKQLIGWCETKMAAVAVEVEEFRTNLDIAKKAKWNTARPKAHLRYAEGRLLFYQKIRNALEAGFYIVPNFPCDIFAIRTGSLGPEGITICKTENYQSRYVPNDYKPDLMESGIGDYVNPEPAYKNSSLPVVIDGKEKHRNELELHGWKDVDFPFVLAKAEVLTATQQAMALKIFDEMGVYPNTKKSDPLVLGIIKAPAKNRFNQKQVTFLVAWFLDTDTL